MSFQTTTPDLFAAPQAQPDLPLAQPLAATEKQMSYARILAAKTGIALPKGIERDRAALSAWIDARRATPATGKFANYPSSKQVAFAERIATLKRNPVPPECFRDKGLMSRWIDSNKPR
jgi:hypothetical protein